jgi:hypothetical protein
MDKYIYALKDPNTHKIRYIGSSNNPNKRYKEHISDTKREKTKKSNWIKNLIKNNQKPILEILEKTSLNEFEGLEKKYIEEQIALGNKLLNFDISGKGNILKKTNKQRQNLTLKTGHTVFQFDLNGNFINKFNSLREAEKMTGVNHGNISKCCNNIFKHTGGYVFSKNIHFDKTKIVKNPNGLKKKIIEIDVNGNVINEFNSITEASLKTKIVASSISRVCNGLLKKTNNKYFKFKTNE